MSAGAQEPLGSVGDEAARLVESLQGWLDGRTGARNPAGRGRFDTAASGGSAGAAEEAAGHGQACRGCPVCRGLAYLQESHPEVLSHLSDAAQHIVAAVRALAAEPAQQPQPSAPRSRPPAGRTSRAVRIDVQPDPEHDTECGTRLDPGVSTGSAGTNSEQEPAP